MADGRGPGPSLLQVGQLLKVYKPDLVAGVFYGGADRKVTPGRQLKMVPTDSVDYCARPK